MPKTEQLLKRIDELQRETGIPRTIFGACPNSPAVIRASMRAAKRNDAPIYPKSILFQNLNLIKGKKYFHSKIFQ